MQPSRIPYNTDWSIYGLQHYDAVVMHSLKHIKKNVHVHARVYNGFVTRHLICCTE